MDMIPGLDSAGAFLMVVVGFGFIIFVHELGHFMAAKAVGIRVSQFAVGFGHAMVAWRKGIGLRVGSTEPELAKRVKAWLIQQNQRSADEQAEPTEQDVEKAVAALGLGETEYRLNWIPLGGYVKMLGQDDTDPNAKSEHHRAFNKRPAWARALVISAGVIMNTIFAVIFFIVAFQQGVAFPPAIVGQVVPDSPASQAYPVHHFDDPAYRGLKPNDRVIAIDGRQPTDFTDLQLAVALASPDQPLQIAVRRTLADGKSVDLTYPIKPQPDALTRMFTIGVGMPVTLELAKPAKGDRAGKGGAGGEGGGGMMSAYAQAGAKPGMKAVSAGGVPITSFPALVDQLEAAEGQSVKVVFQDSADPASRAEVSLSARPNLTPTLKPTGADPKKPMYDYSLLGLVPATEIRATVPGGPASRVAIQPGDLIVLMQQTPWPTTEQVAELVKQAQGRPVTMTLLRKSDFVPVQMTPENGLLGIHMTSATSVNIVAQTLEGSPASSGRWPRGSRLVAVNGQPVADYSDIQRVLKQALSQAMAKKGSGEQVSAGAFEVQLSCKLDLPDAPTETATMAIDEVWSKRLADAHWSAPEELTQFEPLRLPLKADTAWAAVGLGLHKTKHFMVTTYVTLARLFQRTVPFSEMGGPVRIFDAGTQIARDHGWAYLLFFLGLISVNLAVINFLPIPIVDGGLMTILIVEKIKGSPLSPRILSGLNYLGLAIILALFVSVTYFDLIRLWESWPNR